MSFRRGNEESVIPTQTYIKTLQTLPEKAFQSLWDLQNQKTTNNSKFRILRELKLSELSKKAKKNLNDLFQDILTWRVQDLNIKFWKIVLQILLTQ